ncbi:MAG: hypothetical protein LLF89_05855 [Spirochaetaceae bacterium]|nr:hypothetical protein [Spirochaetaceae bacterium]
MKSRFASLAWLFTRTTLDLSLPSRRELKTAKGLLKTMGILFLAAFVIVDIGYVLVQSSLAQYGALKPLGLQNIMLFNASTSALLIVFVFSFLMALSLFSSSGAETAFLSMPIPPAELLAAKMLTVYLLECLFGIIVFLVPVFIFGINESKPGLFYLWGLLNALVLPVAPTALAYALLIPLMNASKVFRNRNVMLYVGGFIGVAFALTFNYYLQSNMSLAPADAASGAVLAGGQGRSVANSLIAQIGRICLPSLLAWKALSAASWPGSLLATLGNLGLGAAIAVPTVLLLGKPYVHCLQHFGESTLTREKPRTRTTAKSSSQAYRQKPVISALVAREFKLMDREPTFFLNGPFVIVLLPLVFIVMYFAQRASLQEAVAELSPLLGGPAAYLIPAAFGVFLGTCASIADTAVSRDAKTLSWMKSLPISARQYFGAKFIHAELFSLTGSALGCAVTGFFLSLGAGDILTGFLLALVASSCLNLAGLWLDAAIPRLKWNNPVAALKQNPNVLIVLFATVGMTVGIGYLCSILQLPRPGYAVAIGAFFLAAGVALGCGFDRWSATRFRKLEA